MGKLENKVNFFSEFTQLKKAFPKEWCQNLIKEKSTKTSVHVKREACIWNGNNVETVILTNKKLYDALCLRKRSESIGINTWTKYLSLKEKPCLSNLYSFIFIFLKENKLKEFRWKLLQFIVPTKVLLHKWKIADSNLGHICNIEEDYYHYFIACDYLSNFYT